MLNKSQILHLLQTSKLIENYLDLETQLTPNGFDVSAGEIFRFESAGSLDFSNKERFVPDCKPEPAAKERESDRFGWWKLTRGAYKVRTNESIHLPTNLTALAFTRTSLLRMGAFTQHGVWDAGFSGKGEFILVVENPLGLKLKQNARVAQLVFFPVEETERYNGIFNHVR